MTVVSLRGLLFGGRKEGVGSVEEQGPELRGGRVQRRRHNC